MSKSDVYESQILKCKDVLDSFYHFIFVWCYKKTKGLKGYGNKTRVNFFLIYKDPRVKN